MEDTFAYIGVVKNCGCIVSACVDSEDRKKDVAKFCSNAIKNDLILKRVNLSEVVVRVGVCNCNKKQAETTLFD